MQFLKIRGLPSAAYEYIFLFYTQLLTMVFSILVNQVAKNYSPGEGVSLVSNVTSAADDDSDLALLAGDVTPLDIVTSVTLCVGLIQTVIGLCRLGSLTIIISDTIISSFTVGASIHVATSQIR